jgi:RND superfamily putative drug exporter
LVRDPADDQALVGAGAPVPPRPRPPHDPTHPGIEGRVGPTRIPPGPPRLNGPSAAGTSRIPTNRPNPGQEPPTTRLSMAKNAVRGAAAQRAKQPSGPAPKREEREIESWLGELRGAPGGGQPPRPTRPTQPSAESTTAMRAGAPKPEPQPEPEPEPEGNEPTTAIPVQRPAQPEENDATTKIPTPQDPDSTEKLDTLEERKRRGGGMSAADLLRREGRM